MASKKVRILNKVFDEKQTFLAKQTIEPDKEKLRGLVENLYSPGPSFQYIFDFPTRSFTFMSDGVKVLFGENPDSFTVDSYASRIHPDDFQHFARCEEIAGHFLFNHIDKKKSLSIK